MEEKTSNLSKMQKLRKAIFIALFAVMAGALAGGGILSLVLQPKAARGEVGITFQVYTDNELSAAGGRIGYGRDGITNYLEGENSSATMICAPGDYFSFSIENNEGFFIVQITLAGLFTFPNSFYTGGDGFECGNPFDSPPMVSYEDDNTIVTYPLIGTCDGVTAPNQMGLYTIIFYFVTDPTYVTEESWIDFVPEDTTFDNEGQVDGSSPEQAYEIANAQQLALLSKRVAEGEDFSGIYFRQTADIYLLGHDWKPIGDYQLPFAGNYDGGGFKVCDINISYPAPKSNDEIERDSQKRSNVGLFGNVASSQITGVTTGGSVASWGNNIGGVVGKATDSTISNCKSYCTLGDLSYFDVDDSLMVRTGGIVGYAVSSTITNCTNFGDIVGYEVGGIVGGMDKAIVSLCKNNGNFSGRLVRQVGGIAGAGSVKISDCVSNATIDTQVSGSLVGALRNSDQFESVVENCMAYGSLGVNCGMFVGRLDGGTIKNCTFVGEGKVNNWAYLPSGGQIVDCCAICGDNKFYSDGQFDGFTVVPGMNGGCPMLKRWFYVAIDGPSTLEYFESSSDWEKQSY